MHFLKPLWVRCLITVILAMLSDMTAAWHLRALVADRLTEAVLSGALLPFANFPGLTFWVNDKTVKGRFCLTASTALAIAISTWIVITWSL